MAGGSSEAPRSLASLLRVVSTALGRKNLHAGGGKGFTRLFVCRGVL
jgi:hypothetical protein